MLYVILTLNQRELPQFYPLVIFRNSLEIWLYLILSSEYANYSKNFRLAATDYLRLYKLTKNANVLNHLISAYIAKVLKMRCYFLMNIQPSRDRRFVVAKPALMLIRIAIKDVMNLVFNFR